MCTSQRKEGATIRGILHVRKSTSYQSKCPENEDKEDEEMDNANSTLNDQGIFLMTAVPTINLPSTTWIADLGTLMHIANKEHGLMIQDASMRQ